MTKEPISQLEIRLFGDFEARLDGNLLNELARRDGARALALLTLHHGRELPNTWLASILWPITGSLDSLRQSIAHLRSVLGVEAHRLQTHKGNLLFDLKGARVDVISFDRAIERGDPVALQE